MFDLTDRKTLIGSLPKGAVCAEIGVDCGAFSQVILDRAEPSRLYLIDCWEHQTDEVVGHDPANAPQHVQDGRYAAVVGKFAHDNRVRVVRAYSHDAVQSFSDASFDWVYLDSNHLQVAQDIADWWPKIARGGWLLGHDYTVAGDFIRVKPAVDAWVACEGLILEVAGLASDDVYERNYPTWIVRKP